MNNNIVNREYSIKSEKDKNIVIYFDINFTKGLTIRGCYKKQFDNPVLLVEEFVESYDLMLDSEWLASKIEHIYNEINKKKETLIEIDSLFKDFHVFNLED